jgi:hypothetical protein
MVYHSEADHFRPISELSFLGHKFKQCVEPCGHAMWFPNPPCDKMRSSLLVYNQEGTPELTIVRACALRNETFACDGPNGCRKFFSYFIDWLRMRCPMGESDSIDLAWTAYKTDNELWELYSGYKTVDTYHESHPERQLQSALSIDYHKSQISSQMSTNKLSRNQRRRANRNKGKAKVIVEEKVIKPSKPNKTKIVEKIKEIKEKKAHKRGKRMRGMRSGGLVPYEGGKIFLGNLHGSTTEDTVTAFPLDPTALVSSVTMGGLRWSKYKTTLDPTSFLFDKLAEVAQIFTKCFWSGCRAFTQTLVSEINTVSSTPIGMAVAPNIYQDSTVNPVAITDMDHYQMKKATKNISVEMFPALKRHRTGGDDQAFDVLPASEQLSFFKAHPTAHLGTDYVPEMDNFRAGKVYVTIPQTTSTDPLAQLYIDPKISFSGFRALTTSASAPPAPTTSALFEFRMQDIGVNTSIVSKNRDLAESKAPDDPVLGVFGYGYLTNYYTEALTWDKVVDLDYLGDEQYYSNHGVDPALGQWVTSSQSLSGSSPTSHRVSIHAGQNGITRTSATYRYTTFQVSHLPTTRTAYEVTIFATGIASFDGQPWEVAEIGTTDGVHNPPFVIAALSPDLYAYGDTALSGDHGYGNMFCASRGEDSGDSVSFDRWTSIVTVAESPCKWAYRAIITNVDSYSSEVNSTDFWFSLKYPQTTDADPTSRTVFNMVVRQLPYFDPNIIPLPFANKKVPAPISDPTIVMLQQQIKALSDKVSLMSAKAFSSDVVSEQKEEAVPVVSSTMLQLPGPEAVGVIAPTLAHVSGLSVENAGIVTPPTSRADSFEMVENHVKPV